MIKIKWIILSFACIVQSNYWSLASEVNDSTHTKKSLFGGKSKVEFPLTIIPITSYNVFFPIGKYKNTNYIETLGGNYIFYPNTKYKIGFLAGISLGEFNSSSFSGDYTYQEKEQFLRISIYSVISNFRFGIKVVNPTSKNRIKPYAEIFLSHIIVASRLAILEKDKDDGKIPMIERKLLEKYNTSIYHINAGIEVNLLNKQTIQDEKNNDRGCFLTVGLGYAHGFNLIRQIDASKAVPDQSEAQNSNLEYIKVNSSKTNFSTFIPQFESKLRYLNVSCGVMYRF